MESHRLIVLGFNDTSTLVGHFVSSPREREKRDRRDSRRGKREGQKRKRDKSESEETEEIKNIPPLPLPATRIAGQSHRLECPKHTLLKRTRWIKEQQR